MIDQRLQERAKQEKLKQKKKNKNREVMIKINNTN